MPQEKTPSLPNSASSAISHDSLKNGPAYTAVIVLADGTVFTGQGFGAPTKAAGEICFNTSMTGYQESLTDPSYHGQIITFTFPHIGNIGTNDQDLESQAHTAFGLITRELPTDPSNWRADDGFDAWLKSRNIPGIANIDTRALTQRIRDAGAPDAIIAYNPDGKFDLDALRKEAARLPGLEGRDLAKDVTCGQTYSWNQALWQSNVANDGDASKTDDKAKTYKIVAIDYGAKHNILRHLVDRGCEVIVVPATTSASDILAHQPDGVFLSNGPGDPAATGVYAVPTVQALIESGKPIFGICLGHQILCLALGGKTGKMHLGHRGANHPVKDLTTGKVEITSQNHGFEVLTESLPDHVETTHISLFDGTNEGIKVKGKPIFSVQYHPESSPGPHDSAYLFDRFFNMIKAVA